MGAKERPLDKSCNSVCERFTLLKLCTLIKLVEIGWDGRGIKNDLALEL